MRIVTCGQCQKMIHAFDHPSDACLFCGAATSSAIPREAPSGGPPLAHADPALLEAIDQAIGKGQFLGEKAAKGMALEALERAPLCGELYWRLLLADCQVNMDAKLLHIGRPVSEMPGFMSAMRHAGHAEPVYTAIDDAHERLHKAFSATLPGWEREDIQAQKPKEHLTALSAQLQEAVAESRKWHAALDEAEKGLEEASRDFWVAAGEYRAALEQIHQYAEALETPEMISEEEAQKGADYLERLQKSADSQMQSLERLKREHPSAVIFGELTREKAEIISRLTEIASRMDQIKANAAAEADKMDRIAANYARARAALEDKDYSQAMMVAGAQRTAALFASTLRGDLNG